MKNILLLCFYDQIISEIKCQLIKILLIIPY